MRKILNFAAAVAASTFGLTLAATPASAAVTLTQPGCDVYGATGCLFSYTPPPGNPADNADLIEAAYNAVHLALPTPEDLPDLTFLGKAESGGSIPYVNNGNSWSFTNLSFAVSFYTVKQANNQFILFGFTNPTNTFTATNTQISPQGISHVSFFGAPGTPPGGVPEPATWAMMIGGFGAAGSMLRRRRMAAVAA